MMNTSYKYLGKLDDMIALIGSLNFLFINDKTTDETFLGDY